MYELTIFIVVAILAYFIVRRFFSIKRFNTKEEYLQYKREQEEMLREEEEEWDDDLIDKKSFDFLFIGVVATVLFLACGLFTGNPFYFVLMIFVITAILFLHYFPSKGDF